MKYIAHRGLDKHKYKENSLDAFKYCFNCNYIDGIELDIRLTKDKKIVISHDEFDGIYRISDTKYKKLKVDLLESVLKIANNKIILIDIKDSNVIEPLYILLSKYKLNYYISSFNYEIINKFNSNYKVGLIIGYMINIDKIKNNFTFNSIHYNLINRISNRKEIFIWTVNSKKILDVIKKHGNNFYIITDKAYLLQDKK